MTEKQESQFIDRLGEALSSPLEQCGFVQQRRCQWSRKADWKEDAVIVVPRGLNFMINLAVWLPPEPGSQFDAQPLAFTNLPHVLGRTDACYRYPAWFRSAKRAVGMAKKDLEMGIKWFDSFDSPAKCLEFVLKGGMVPGSPAYNYCKLYLEGVGQ
jgi:hypothetical protein